MAERLSFSDTKVVAVLALYELLVSDTAESCSSAEIRKRFGENISRNLLKRALDDLEMSNYVKETTNVFVAGEDDWTILGDGISYAERLLANGVKLNDLLMSDHTASGAATYEDLVPASDRVVSRNDNAWNEPDYEGEIGPETEERIRNLIQQAINDLPKAELSNSEQSQALARLESAQKLADAPEPQWRKVAEILAPMEKIAVIGASITLILQALVPLL